MKISFEGSLAEFRAVFASAAGVSAYDPGPDLVTITSAEPEPELLVRDHMNIGPSEERPIGQAMRADLPVPKTVLPESVQKTLDNLPKISPEVRREAWEAFKEFCTEWVRGFGDDEVKFQPDRGKLVEKLGGSRHTIPVLVMAFETLSLQRLVEKALVDGGYPLPSDSDTRLNFVDEVSANMVQVSHIGFPELANTYDYSLRWRRAA